MLADLDIERVCIADIAYKRQVSMDEARRIWAELLPSRREAKRSFVRFFDQWLDRRFRAA